MASLPTITRFKSSGSPQTGLSPTVNIRRVAQDGAVVSEVSSAAMTEVADGLYKYNFTNFNALYNYVFTFDAGATSDSRYTEAIYSGVQGLIDLIPRGGGGGSSFTASHLDSITKALETRITELFAQFEIEVPEVIFDTSEIKDLIKQATAQSKEVKQELTKLINKADSKIEEIKNPEITTQEVIVETKEVVVENKTVDMTDVIKTIKSLEKLVKDSDNTDEMLGVFAKFLQTQLVEVIEIIKEK